MKHEKLIMSQFGCSVMWNIQNRIYDHLLHKFSLARLFVEWFYLCSFEYILFPFNGFYCDHNTLLMKELVWASRTHTGKYFQLVLPIKLIVFRRGEVLWELLCRNALPLILYSIYIYVVGDDGQSHYTYEFFSSY